MSEVHDDSVREFFSQRFRQVPEVLQAAEEAEGTHPAGRAGEEKVLKKTRHLLDSLGEGWAVVAQDESIFVYDSIVRAVWALKGSKPRVLINGSHKKTFVFGSVSKDSRQMFR